MSRKYAHNVSITERLISLAIGGKLLYRSAKAIHQRPLSALAGGYLLYRGITGYCPVNRWIGKKDTHNPAINVKSYLTINKPREAVYRYWRRLQHLPEFMTHLQRVEEKSETRSHWIAKIPGMPRSIAWDAEIVEDQPGYFIGWRSLPGSMIENAGKVEFSDAPNRNGTEVQVVFSYHPPAGSIGTGIARLLNPLFKSMIEGEIRNFKRVLETGEIPTTKGQPTGKRTGTIKII